MGHRNKYLLKIQFIFFIMFISACTQVREECSDVRVDFIINSKVKRSSQVKLFIIKKNNGIVYYYSDSENYKNNYTAKITRNERNQNISFNDVVCEKIGEKTFSNDQELIIVEQFYYDIPESEDEEFVFFFNNEYGLFLTNSSQWRTVEIFRRKNNGMHILIDKILNDDFLEYPPRSDM
jgi:c-di-AMP phosphodiesterase-like protein